MKVSFVFDGSYTGCDVDMFFVPRIGEKVTNTAGCKYVVIDVRHDLMMRSTTVYAKKVEE